MIFSAVLKTTHLLPWSVRVGPAFSHQTTQKRPFWFDKAACVPALQADPLRVELLATKLFLHGLTPQLPMQ